MARAWRRIQREPAIVSGVLLILVGIALLAAFAAAVVLYVTDMTEFAGDGARSGLAVLFLGVALPAGGLGLLAAGRGWRTVREPGGDGAPARSVFTLVAVLAAVGLAAVATGGWDVTRTGAAVLAAAVVVEGWITSTL